MADHYTPTTNEVMRSYRFTPKPGEGQREGESFAEFLSRRSIEAMQQQIAENAAAHRWLAEVQRKAAEEALLKAADTIERHAARTDNTFTEHAVERAGGAYLLREYAAEYKKAEE